MTVVRYRCEHRPHIARELERSLYIPRALTRPVAGNRAATTQPHRAALEMHSAPESRGDRREQSLRGLRILCVEDDNDARELVSIILAHAGALVECAASAEDGFDVLHN